MTHTNEYTVFDPATLEPVGSAPNHTADDVAAAAERAKSALRSWAKNIDARRDMMLQVSVLIRAEQEAIARTLTAEQGKPLRDALQEVAVCADLIEYYAKLPFEPVVQLEERMGRTPRIEYRPVGVVGAITPWNYPLSLLIVKIAPALLAGCTIVARPSASTPLSTMQIVEVMNRVLPDNVIQTCTSRDRTVSVALATNAAVNKISFTGSTGVGVSLAQTALETVKRVTLELGGNDPAIVLEDVNVGAVAEQIMSSAFRNSGQVCMAAKRIYVHESIAQDFIDATADIVSGYSLGHGLDEGSSHGPLHTRTQVEQIEHMVKEAAMAGGRVVTGGRVAQLDLPGNFFEPTIVANARHGMRLVDEEQFANALPIITYSRVEDAIAQANDSEFGLGASVWGNDLERADEVAVELEAGTVWVNQHTVVELDAPFGGWKQSGLGRERGRVGLDPYLETRTVNIAPPR